MPLQNQPVTEEDPPVSVRLGADLRAKVLERAAKSQRTVSGEIRFILAEFLGLNKEGEK